MNRRIYLAILKENEGISKIINCKQRLLELSNENKIENPSVFKYENSLFFYYEFCNEEISPESIFAEAADILEQWTGPSGKRVWVPMHDIFHYQAPQNPQEWRRKTKVEMPWGRVIRLKPDMIASYIFYHFQYQEEKPGDGDKFGLIGIHEDLLFFYSEKPAYKDKPLYQGLLNTNNSPSNWGSLMRKHFKDWENPIGEDDCWRETEVLITLF